MNLSRTRAAFDIINAQVGTTKPDQFIESCLAQYLSVILYAEMEERISEIVTMQLQKFTNRPIGQYLTQNMEKIIRRTSKSDIASLLAAFGDKFKYAFNELVSETDVSLYSNVITARHSVGHRQGSNITLIEIHEGIDAADKILIALS